MIFGFERQAYKSRIKEIQFTKNEMVDYSFRAIPLFEYVFGI